MNQDKLINILQRIEDDESNDSTHNLPNKTVINDEIANNDMIEDMIEDSSLQIKDSKDTLSNKSQQTLIKKPSLPKGSKNMDKETLLKKKRCLEYTLELIHFFKENEKTLGNSKRERGLKTKVTYLNKIRKSNDKILCIESVKKGIDKLYQQYHQFM